MSLGLIGRKVGMTRIFMSNGDSIAVSIIDVSNNRITQIKTIETDGYNAVQVAFGECHIKHIKCSLKGHFAKASIEAGKILKEFCVSVKELNSISYGSKINTSLFLPGQVVDVCGTTIGKGYAGTIKRYNFSSGRASHGNSRSHRVPGSISMAQDPGRVFPGKRMTGHLGNVMKTIQNLQVMRTDMQRNLLVIKGAIPGSRGGIVFITPAIKKVIQSEVI